MKASEVIKAREVLINWADDQTATVVDEGDMIAIVDFLLTNDYLSDKFFTEALNNEGE